MKSAVINRETNVVENIVMADPSDPWPFTDTFLVLVPDNFPISINNTYSYPNFYDNINHTYMDPNLYNNDSIITPIEDITNGS